MIKFCAKNLNESEPEDWLPRSWLVTVDWGDVKPWQRPWALRIYGIEYIDYNKLIRDIKYKMGLDKNDVNTLRILILGDGIVVRPRNDADEAYFLFLINSGEFTPS